MPKEYARPGQKRGRRRMRWSPNEIYSFLNLWHQRIDEMRSGRKHAHIYIDMQIQLKEQGITVECLDIKTKIDTLTRKFRAERDLHGPSSKWVYYAKMAEILEPLEAYNRRERHEESSSAIFSSIYIDECDSLLLDGEEDSTYLIGDIKDEQATVCRVTSSEEIYDESVLKNSLAENYKTDSPERIDTKNCRESASSPASIAYEDNETEFSQLIAKELQKLNGDLRIETKRKIYNLICDMQVKQLKRT